MKSNLKSEILISACKKCFLNLFATNEQIRCGKDEAEPGNEQILCRHANRYTIRGRRKGPKDRRARQVIDMVLSKSHSAPVSQVTFSYPPSPATFSSCMLLCILITSNFHLRSQMLASLAEDSCLSYQDFDESEDNGRACKAACDAHSIEAGWLQNTAAPCHSRPPAPLRHVDSMELITRHLGKRGVNVDFVQRSNALNRHSADVVKHHDEVSRASPQCSLPHVDSCELLGRQALVSCQPTNFRLCFLLERVIA